MTKTYNADHPLKILSLGWGVQSWTLAAMAGMGEIPMPDYAIHADTTHELSATYAHAEKYTPWLEEHGVKVITVQNPKPEATREDWAGGILIPAYARQHETSELGIARRMCTNHWKIQPIRQFIRTLINKPRPGSVEMLSLIHI